VIKVRLIAQVAVAQTMNGRGVSDRNTAAPGNPNLASRRQIDGALVDRHPAKADDLVAAGIEPGHLEVHREQGRIDDPLTGIRPLPGPTARPTPPQPVANRMAQLPDHSM